MRQFLAAWLRAGAALAGIVLLAGCAALRPPKPAGDPDLPPVPIPAADKEPVVPPSQPADARIAEMQTQMTELLERLDVLNARIAKLEQGPPAAAVPPTPQPRNPVTAQPASTPQPTTTATRSADIADAYKNALMLVGKGRQTEARAAFQHVYDADPNGELADNALYWIGETYFNTGNYAEAMRYYARVTKDFADQNKAPDAMFKMGLAYVRTGDLAMAKRTFEECVAKYPYSTPAAAAKFELKRIKY